MRLYRPKRLEGRSFNGRQSIDDLYRKTNDWKNYRERYLAENPTCYSCGALSTVVDHVTPHLGDKILFEKLDNHLALCAVCHNKITAMFDRKYVKGTSIDRKLKWIQKNRDVLGVTVRAKVLPHYHDTESGVKPLALARGI